MQRLALALALVLLAAAAGCQTRPVSGGGYGGSRQPLPGENSIAAQSRRVQGSSFGNR
jgi:hypothetical protein